MSLTRTAQKQLILAKIALEKPTHRFTNLYHLMYWDEWLSLAANSVLNKQGSETAGIDKQTKDAFKANQEAEIVSASSCPKDVYPKEGWQEASFRHSNPAGQDCTGSTSSCS